MLRWCSNTCNFSYFIENMVTDYFAEASLSGVEPLMQKIHGEIRRVDAEILAAVRQQVGIFILFLIT